MSETFGALLAAHRARRGMSQRQLSDDCWWDHSYVGRLERDQRRPSRESVLAIIRALQLDEAHAAELLVAAGFWPGPRGAVLALDALSAARAAGLGNKWE